MDSSTDDASGPRIMAITGTIASSTTRLQQQRHNHRRSSTRNKRNVLVCYFFSLVGGFLIVLFLFHSHNETLLYGNSYFHVVPTFMENTLQQFMTTTTTATTTSSSSTVSEQLELVGLQCESYGGGPTNETIANEMVYWQDIPSDEDFVSPFYDPRHKFLTFEPDAGGWNNIRMSMETVLAMALAMGRTLVLPPEASMYLLGKSTGKNGKQQKNTFSFTHFFPMAAIASEHSHSLQIWTMQQFLETIAMRGHMQDPKTQKVTFPPYNITAWDGRRDIPQLYKWLRSVTYVPTEWNPEKCLAVFPNSTDPEDVQKLRSIEESIVKNPPNFEDYVGRPVPVDGTPTERFREHWAHRERMCIYEGPIRDARYVHFPMDDRAGARLLVHFYAFLNFQNYHHDLFIKRFVRDHVRYVDEIQCAAARVVEAVRKRAMEKYGQAQFDAFHVRRGDFQYKVTRVDAKILLEMAQRKIPRNTVLYVATDERNKSFFDPLKQLYDVVFLDDFHDQALQGVNTNFYGMIDQLVASRSRTFFGCWFSTFTGYIMRLRGYHQSNQNTDGILPTSWYYVLPDRFDHMQKYYPVKKSFFAREFPTSWRLLDQTHDLN